MKKGAIILVLLLVSASSAFAAVDFSVDAIGLWGGGRSLVEEKSAVMGGNTVSMYKPALGPLSATAVTATFNNMAAISVATINIALDKDYTMDEAETVSGYLLAGYLKFFQMGMVSNWVGVEYASENYKEAKISATTTNINYRAKAKVLGDVSLILDVELLSTGTCDVDGDSQGTVATTFDNCKLGVSIPVYSL